MMLWRQKMKAISMMMMMLVMMAHAEKISPSPDTSQHSQVSVCAEIFQREEKNISRKATK